MPSYKEFKDAIHAGELDDFLDELAGALVLRRRDMARQKSYQLDPGDTIIIASTCKPKMLANARVIFRGRDASRLRVELTRTYSQKWRAGNIIRIPVGLVGEVRKSEE